MKLSEQEIHKKKAEILAASQTCFIRKGFHNTTMQDICGESQMSAGNIYRYFDSKEMIIEAFTEEELQWMTTAIGDLTSSPDLMRAIIDTIFWTAATLMQNGKPELMAELFAEAGRNPRINAIYTRFNKRLTQEVCQTLEEAENNKLISSRHDMQKIAKILISLVDGLVLNTLISANLDLMTMRPLIESMVTSLFEVPIEADERDQE